MRGRIIGFVTQRSGLEYPCRTTMPFLFLSFPFPFLSFSFLSLSFPFLSLSFPFLSFPFLSFPFLSSLSFPFLSFSFLFLSSPFVSFLAVSICFICQRSLGLPGRASKKWARQKRPRKRGQNVDSGRARGLEREIVRQNCGKRKGT